MENASKALVIAGGILLAIMTLSLLVYMTGSTSRMAQAQDEKKAAEQLVAFNNQYEAYNKRVMYGTDLITLVNKAINYNKNLDPNDSNKDIQIKITTIQKFETTEKTIQVDGNNKIIYESGTKILPGLSLDAGTYTIDYNTADSNQIIVFFKQKAEEYAYNVKEKKVDNQLIIEKTVHYSALTNLKRAIFECTDVDYENGRIKSMTFKQKKINN